MDKGSYLFTSESVTEGHPDKLADQISDAVLDSILANDQQARVACECLVTTGLVVVGGEITTCCYVDIPQVVRDTICRVGYTRAKYGFDGETCGVLTTIDEQSSDIAQGVDQAQEAKEGLLENGYQLGAGDQGMMFGYATDETPELMPLPIILAHRLAQRMTQVRKDKTLPFLRPDGKTQVTVEYEDGKPLRVDTVLLAAQHHPETKNKELKEALMEEVVKRVVPAEMMDGKTSYLVNPTGRFVIGGPQSDTGLTGRKIIVDTYGGAGRHGGGAFSGKDPTKVDRSASYAARKVAKNIVASGLASRCEVQIAYAIGVARPVSVMVETFGTGRVEEERIEALVQEVFDLRPGKIIEEMDLMRPIYHQLAAYGHFGRPELDLPWEETDYSQELKSLARS